MSHTGDELWARFRDHREESAFRVLLEKTGGLVQALCRSVLGNDAEAEEAFQETYAALFRDRAKLPSYPAAVAWLMETARNKARMQRRWRLRLTWRERQKAAVSPTTTDEAACGLADQERTTAVIAAVASLPTRERRAVELVYLSGMSHTEAAAVLGWSRGTVGTYVQRGLEWLRSRLGPMGVAALATPVVVPERLLASADTIWAKAVAVGVPFGGWPVPRVQSLGVLMACLGVAGGVAWWPRPDPVAAPPVQREDVPTEALQARNLRVMQTEIAPRLREVFQELVPGDNPIVVEATRAWGSEVEAEFRTARPMIGRSTPPRIKVRYCVHRRQMFMANDINPAGEYRPNNRGMPGRIELKIAEGLMLTLPFGQKQFDAADELVRLLPQDDRAEQAHLENLFGPPGRELVLPTTLQAVWGTDQELFVATEKDESLYVRRSNGRWQYLGQCPNGSLLTSDDKYLYCTDWATVYALPIDRYSQPWQPISSGVPPRGKDSVTCGLHVVRGKLMVTVLEQGVLKLWSRGLSEPAAEWSLYLQAPGAHSWIVAGDRLYAMFDDRLASRPLGDPTADWRTEGPPSPDGARALFRLRGTLYAMRGTAGPIYSRPLAVGHDVGWQRVGRLREPVRDGVEVEGP